MRAHLTRNSRGRRATDIEVGGLSMSRARGWLTAGWLRAPCALGRSGRRVLKREGDGATPVGLYALRRACYRRDQMLRPRTALPMRAIRPNDGWCDAVGDRNYNRQVSHPYPASAERMWRSDELYDVVIVLDHNDRPRIQGAGSAVFMHLARSGCTPTAGCVALARHNMSRLLAHVRRGARMLIHPCPSRPARPRRP